MFVSVCFAIVLICVVLVCIGLTIFLGIIACAFLEDAYDIWTPVAALRKKLEKM